MEPTPPVKAAADASAPVAAPAGVDTPSASLAAVAPTKRLMYVDDIPHRLAQAQEELRSLRSDWQLVFARSGVEAVDCMDQSPFDAVITEMQMEQTNGVEMLNKVMRRHPRTLRLVRCTESEVELTKSCLGTPPYILPRCCDVENFETVLVRAFQIEQWMSDDALKKLYSQLTTLPTLPVLYNQVTAELQSPVGSMEFVARLISKDPVMTAKMLQMVNSASMAMQQQIMDPVDAVMFLGAERVKSLILISQVFTQFNKTICPGFLIEQLWMHCMSTGAYSMSIAMAETRNAQIAEMAFTAGLLHDVGMLLIAANLPARYSQVLKQAADRRVSVRDVEMEVFGASHAEVGACLLGVWGLPLPILEAIAWHHCPEKSRHREFSLLTAVHAANAIDYEKKTRAGQTPLFPLNEAYLDQLGLGQRVDHWRQLCGGPANAGTAGNRQAA